MNRIKIAVGAILAATAASGAYAQNSGSAQPTTGYDIVSYNNGSPQDQVFISGSTAVDNTIENVMAGSLCATTPGTINGVATNISTLSVYYLKPGQVAASSGSYTERVMTCESNGTGSITAGDRIVAFKESIVGSANGVQPLINVAQGAASSVNFVNAAQLAADGGEGGCTSNQEHDASAGGAIPPYAQYWSCTANAADVDSAGNDIPSGGVADVEAAILRTASGAVISTTLETSFLTLQPGFDTVWGMPVTQNLYYALQAAEGLGAGGTLVSGCNTANNDAPACAPTLSRAQIASLYGGGITKWTQLGVTNATDDNVYVCRRDTGSGSEASIEAYFLNARCGTGGSGAGALAMRTENSSTVWANGSTSTVLGCLENIQAGGTQTNFAGTSSHTFSGGAYAIGVASSEIKESQVTGDGNTMRMIAVDGVLPTLANAINGVWPFFSTDALYTVKPAFPGAPTGTSLQLWNDFKAAFQSPTFVKINDSAYTTTPWGAGGDLVSSATQLISASTMFQLPVNTATAESFPNNPWSKTESGKVNNCSIPILGPNQTQMHSVGPSVLLGTGNVND